MYTAAVPKTVHVFRKRIRVQTNVDQTQVPVWGTKVQSGVLGLCQEISWGKTPKFSQLTSSPFNPLPVWTTPPSSPQILSVDQWGLEASVLPSLVVCGTGCLDLQSSQDPSVLCFGSSKGKSVLQAGSVQGLMAYLYARCVRSPVWQQLT